MERRDYYPSCEAPIHNDRCDGVGNTRDHFTARSIGKLVGIPKKLIESQSNIQYLSEPCHRDKDHDTPLRLEVLRMERRGVVLTFEQHRAIFNEKAPLR